MSQHKQAMSPELRQALINHGLETDTPSQLADCFRNGWKARAVKDAVGGEAVAWRVKRSFWDDHGQWNDMGGCNDFHYWKDEVAAGRCTMEFAYLSPQASAAVPDGALSIARRMIEEAKENDHCTAHPVFIVQKRRLVTGIDTEYTDNIAWVSEGEILDAEESLALEAAYQEVGEVPDGYTRTGYCEEWEHIDTYLTERAALSRCGGAPDYRVTVESAYRNKEMQIVRAFLMSLAASQPEVKNAE